MDEDAITGHAHALLRGLGLDLSRPSTVGTPRRWIRALVELTEGLRSDPADFLDRTFPPETDDPGMIVVPGIRFASLCEHHMLPFTGVATVAYLPKPGAEIVGLSKIPRVVGGFAARPQVQERLGQQIVEAITSRLTTEGAACLIRSSHSCMTARGVRADGAEMVTSHLTGVFRTDPTVRAEWFSIVGGR